MDFNMMSLLLWLDKVAIISFGFIGGVYFAFSFFVMQSLKKTSAPDAIRTMNTINLVILKSPFMLLFFFSSFIALILFLENLILYKLISNEGFASLIFLLGMFICTAAKNVPLNNKLAEFDFYDSNCNPEIEWNDYYKNWIKWNHIRTTSCFISMVLLLIK
ncbi:DUF1772 domain-containing protein [bacterium]|jgi:uncharacterized membrane protein|nr:DUF1772 domain-containing protein [bacterium]MBT5733614.1 DUF1772 domain-containing protein [bacterium]MBT6777968.1 DUF1772 domain-containing protein [bacterium]